MRILEKYSDTTFHKNPFSSSRLIPCGRTDRQTDIQSDIRKLIAAFGNFAKSPTKYEEDSASFIL